MIRRGVNSLTGKRGTGFSDFLIELANSGVIIFDFLKPFRHPDRSTFSVHIDSFIFFSYAVIGNSSQLTLNVLKIEQNSEPGRPRLRPVPYLDMTLEAATHRSSIPSHPTTVCSGIDHFIRSINKWS